MRPLSALPLVLLASACSIEEKGAPGTDPGAKLELSVEADSLAVVLAAPPAVQSGDDVPITITLRNATARSFDLALLGRDIAYDIIVAHDDSIVWQRLYGQTIPSILQLKTLQPNEAIELMDVWHAAVPPGTYTVTASVPTDAQPLTPRPVPITVR